jgi:chromosome segregation ATPase
MHNRLIALLLTFSLLPLAAEARQFFRYEDANGQTVINSSIPPEFVRKGYEIIDDKGVVLREVAPQLSDEAIRNRRAEEQRIAEQRTRDAELVKLYRSPGDVERAMSTWLSRLDMEIRLKDNRIDILQSNFNDLQSQAADQERAGEEVDPELLERMNAIQSDIADYQSEIDAVEDRKDEARSEFTADRQRMRVIYERLNGRPWEDPNPSD